MFILLGEDPGLGEPSRLMLLGLLGDLEESRGDSDRSRRFRRGYLQLAVLRGLLDLSSFALGIGKLPLRSASGSFSGSSLTSPPMPKAARAKYLSNSSSSMLSFITVGAETKWYAIVIAALQSQLRNRINITVSPFVFPVLPEILKEKCSWKIIRLHPRKSLLR